MCQTAPPWFSSRHRNANSLLAYHGPLRYSTGEQRGGTPPMDDATQNPAPEDERTFTLYRFCRNHGLSLDDRQRSAQGCELAKLAREHQLPLRKIRERIRPVHWSKSLLYPEWFLQDWLARYTRAQAEADAALTESVSEPQPTAANG